MINWKLRFKNKATLIAIIGATVAFIYQILGLVGVVPPISEAEVNQVIGLVINMLVALGILTDPTTAGISDSDRALCYDEPRNDEDEELEDEDHLDDEDDFEDFEDEDDDGNYIDEGR